MTPTDGIGTHESATDARKVQPTAHPEHDKRLERRSPRIKRKMVRSSPEPSQQPGLPKEALNVHETAVNPPRTSVRTDYRERNTAEDDNSTEYYSEEYAIDRIVAHAYAENGTLLYRIRWFGYGPSADTWQPTADLPRSKTTAYCTRKRLAIPASIENAQPG